MAAFSAIALMATHLFEKPTNGDDRLSMRTVVGAGEHRDPRGRANGWPACDPVEFGQHF